MDSLCRAAIFNMTRFNRRAVYTLLLLSLFAYKVCAEQSTDSKNSTELFRRWEPEPQGRGTMSILISCLLTLAICVWTSIHLNVVTDPTPTRLFLMRFGWMLAGIFTPEVTMWIAYRQWMDARELLGDVKKRLEITEEPGRFERFKKFLLRTFCLLTGRLKHRNASESGHTDEIGLEASNIGNSAEQSAPKPENEQNLSIKNGTLRYRNTAGNANQANRSSHDIQSICSQDDTAEGKGCNQTAEEQCPICQGKDPHNNKTSDPSDFNFGMKSAFFIVAGGLAVAVPGEVEGHPITITTEGFLGLYDEALISISTINDKVVEDKSKSDGLAKALVLLQAVWLLVQCIGRVASGLPSALLEIHTSIHVVCALGTYLLWWYKPQGVLYPVTIPSVGPVKQFYFQFMEENQNTASKGRKLNLDTLEYDNLNSFRERFCRFRAAIHQHFKSIANEIRIQNTWSDKLTELLLVANTIDVVKKNWQDTFIIGLLKKTQQKKSSIGVEHNTLFDKSWFTIRNRLTAYNSFSTTRALNFVGETVSSPSVKRYIDSLGIGGSITLYGGLHAAAWTQNFPTKIEGLLWLYSSILATAFFATLVVIVVVGVIVPSTIDDEFDNNCASFIFATIAIPTAILVFPILILSFLAARVYLVIESFFSLRYMQVDVFRTVPWSNYWPHF